MNGVDYRYSVSIIIAWYKTDIVREVSHIIELKTHNDWQMAPVIKFHLYIDFFLD